MVVACAAMKSATCVSVILTWNAGWFIYVRARAGKDRILPFGDLLCRGVKTYLQQAHPQTFLFEGNNGEAFSSRGAQWIMSQAVKKSGIVKEDVSLHTLRHTYATHLLEQGVNIVTIKELLGHAHIDTTMIYLHLARPMFTMAFSPMDTLYTPRI